MYITPQINISNNSPRGAMCEKDTVVLTVTAGASTTFQWYKDGSAITDSVRSQLLLQNISKGDEGTYFCIVTKGAVSKQTDPKFVTMQTPPDFISQPLTTWMELNTLFTADVIASGSKPLNYLWYKNDTVLGGETTSRLLIASFKLGNEGAYKCSISNQCGFIISAAAGFYVMPDITLTGVDSSGQACEGFTGYFSCTQCTKYNIPMAKRW